MIDQVDTTSYIWYIGDLYLIIPNKNGIDYTNQVGGRLKEELSSKGYLLPLPIFDNQSLKHEFLTLFGQGYDGVFLNDHKDIHQQLNLLLKICALDDIIEIDAQKLHASCNQWIHILIKKPLPDANELLCVAPFNHQNKTYPIEAILTWSLLYLNDIAPINRQVDIDHLKSDMKIWQSIKAKGGDIKSLIEYFKQTQKTELSKLCQKQIDFISFETKKIMISIGLMEDLLAKAQALDIPIDVREELKEEIAAMKAVISSDMHHSLQSPKSIADN